MDEPEALAGLSLAAREGLDNLTFVVNCNLQRLDGRSAARQDHPGTRGALPRRRLECDQVIWGREWDDLLARDVDGALVNKMNELLDGDFQKFSVAGGPTSGSILRAGSAPARPGRAPYRRRAGSTAARRPRLSQLYAAYRAATEYRGAPTVILAKTIKGWTLGPGVEARNITHQAKKLSEAELRIFRDRLQLPIPDSKLKEAPYYHPGPDSDEIHYMIERRRPWRSRPPARSTGQAVAGAAPEVDREFAAGSEMAVSTTMAFGRLLRNLIRDPQIGPRIVPIVPDEARTFGLDPLFKEVGIYSSLGQLYEPVDSDLVLSYREAVDGQVLEEGSQRRARSLRCRPPPRPTRLTA